MVYYWFLHTLVGSKIALAYATGKSRDFLTGNLYIYIMRSLGAVLVIFSFYFIIHGLEYMI